NSRGASWMPRSSRASRNWRRPRWPPSHSSAVAEGGRDVVREVRGRDSREERVVADRNASWQLVYRAGRRGVAGSCRSHQRWTGSRAVHAYLLLHSRWDEARPDTQQGSDRVSALDLV